MTTLGERVRALRQQQGLSLRELEGRTGLSNGYLSLLEHDRIKNPKPPVLYQVASALGVSYAELMTLAGYVPDQPQVPAPHIMFKGVDQLSPEQRRRVQDFIDFTLQRPRPEQER